MRQRLKGFTLIELLVVIAIIAILAGMLFPVFARARESARKIQCLSNVKNVAMAVQMYLVDYNRFWPSGMSQQNVSQWVDENCGGCQFQCRSTEMNPYLRPPVILEEYTRNRGVWTCPSAKFSALSLNGLAINSCTPDWFTVFANSMANGDCPRPRSCTKPFPPGWGGDVTDTVTQGRCATGPGTFDQSISNPCILRDRTPESSHDVSRLVVCGDAGIDYDSNYTDAYAYPDISRWKQAANVDCESGWAKGNCSTSDDCGNASVAATCSPLAMCFGGDGRISLDASYRKQFARHLGGDNLGFADGHAEWMSADRILLGGHDHTRNGIHPQLFYGLCVCTNLTTHSRWDLPEWTDPTAGVW